MEDYIRRGAAIDRVLERLPLGGLMDDVESVLLDIPSENVRPVVHAEWIDSYGLAKCSDCKAEFMNKYKFCPECGADMRIVQEEVAKNNTEPVICGERKYVALSIKHTAYRWKFGMACMLWGWHQTNDDEPRCYGGYTSYLNKAERYSIDEFIKKYGDDIVCREQVHMTPDLCRKYRDYDTVLVDADEYRIYCMVSGLAVDPPDEEAAS